MSIFTSSSSSGYSVKVWVLFAAYRIGHGRKSLADYLPGTFAIVSQRAEKTHTTTLPSIWRRCPRPYLARAASNEDFMPVHIGSDDGVAEVLAHPAMNATFTYGCL